MTDEATVSLDGLASGAIAAHADTITGMTLDVRQHECPEALVTGSATLLARMVQNVIDNAARHNCKSGWVRIRTDVMGPVAHLVVENGGPVLGQDDVQYLAQPFRRLGAERTGSDTGAGAGPVDRRLHRRDPRRLAGPARPACRRPAGHHHAPGGSARDRPDAGMRVLVVEDARSIADGIAEGLSDQGM